MARQLRITLAIMAAVLIVASPAIFAAPGDPRYYNYLALVFHIVPTPTITPIPTAAPTFAIATNTPSVFINTPTPVVSTPTATNTPVPATPTRGPSLCAAEYPTVCIPPPPPDLNCTDIIFRRFTVLPPDRHNFDTDHDGIGCESG